MRWFPFWHRDKLDASRASIFFTNTLTGKKELFMPMKQGVVTMYSCGPTVYRPQHIGNLKAPLFADLIARVLIEAGYHVRRVINITDVGHLVGDGDHGEDKIEKSAKEEQTSPEEISKRYTERFLDDLENLNVDTENILFPRATEYIREQIAMIKTLSDRDFAYPAEDGIYFDTSKFPEYGELGGVRGAKLLPGARIEKIKTKRNAHDFVLWRNAKPDDLQQWDSPWGRGNPGWHIECSAMSKALLGTQIDIHTGGIDHIPVHHNNEIAQSESANGRRPFVRYWMHEAFVTVNDEKISKSLGNDVYLSKIIAQGFEPLALRYFFLQAHYATPMSFTWEAFSASAEALKRLRRRVALTREEAKATAHNSEERERFIALVRDDLLTPQALGLLWDSLRSEELSPEQKWGLVVTADALFALNLAESTLPAEPSSYPSDIAELVYKRDLSRGAKDYATADDLRYQLEKRGYRVEDSSLGTLLSKDGE